MKGFKEVQIDDDLSIDPESSYQAEFIPREIDIKTIKQSKKKCKSEINCLFKQLKIISQSNKEDHVTRKFLRVVLIRGHKRILRNIYVGKQPKDKLNKLDNNNSGQVSALEQLTTHFKENLNILKKLSKTQNGPLSDGKTQRKRNQDVSNLERSYNKKFAAIYFSNDIAKLSFRYYIEYLFKDSIPNMIKKYGFTCCNENHQEKCEEIWFMLKMILMNNFS